MLSGPHIRRHLVLADCPRTVGTLVDVDRSRAPDDWQHVLVARLVDAVRGKKPKLWSTPWLDDCDSAAGVHYVWGLSGPRGAWFELYRLPWHSDEEIKRAKSALRHSQDVVSLKVVTVTRMQNLLRASDWMTPVRCDEIEQAWYQAQEEKNG